MTINLTRAKAREVDVGWSLIETASSKFSASQCSQWSWRHVRIGLQWSVHFKALVPVSMASTQLEKHVYLRNEAHVGSSGPLDVKAVPQKFLERAFCLVHYLLLLLVRHDFSLTLRLIHIHYLKKLMQTCHLLSTLDSVYKSIQLPTVLRRWLTRTPSGKHLCTAVSTAYVPALTSISRVSGHELYISIVYGLSPSSNSGFLGHRSAPQRPALLQTDVRNLHLLCSFNSLTRFRELIYPRNFPPDARTNVPRPSQFGITDAEELMKMTQGHLVQFPYDWLLTEEHNGNWGYQVDGVAPLAIQ